MEIATVTSKGQVTVPKRIRDFLGLDTGAKIIFVQMADGSVRMVNADRGPGETGSLNELREGAAAAPETEKKAARKKPAVKRPAPAETGEKEKTEEPVRKPKRKGDLNSYLL